MRTVLLAALVALGSALPSFPALAQDDELPRHRPRVTAPDEDEEDSPARTQRRRKHTVRVEDGEDGGDAERDTPSGFDSEGGADRDRDRGRSRRGVGDDALDSERSEPSADRASTRDDALPARDDADRPSRSTGDDRPVRDEGDEGPSRDRPGRYDDDQGLRDDEDRPRRSSEEGYGSRRRSDEDDDGARSRRRRNDDESPRDRRPRPRTAEEELRSDESREDARLSGLDEPGYGLAAELHLGAMLLDDAIGGTRARFAWGLDFLWQFGRLFAPENEFLHGGLFLEATYINSLSSTLGTEQVKVASGYHHLSLAALVGYPIKMVVVYGKVGPAMFIQPVSYDVQGQLTEWTGVKGGFLYGIGVRTSLYLSRQIGVSTRVELTRYRRQYLDDTLISGGVGLAF